MCKNKYIKASLFLVFSFLILMISGCRNQIKFDLDFMVDEEVYHSISTAGEEVIEMPEDPTKENYVFDGWWWDNGLWQREFSFNSLLDEKLTKNMSVYAKWLELDVTERHYKVTFNTSGGSDVETQSILYNRLAQKPSNLTKGGYILTGWFKEEACLNKWDFENDVIIKDITLYAKWEIQYTVTFDTNGGSFVDSITNHIEGKKISEPEEPTKIGSYFLGWYKEEECLNQWDFDNDVISKDLTLYAKWSLYLRDGDYIYFGEYPQTIKSESVVISSTQDSRGYYLGSDGAYYAKVVASPYGSSYTFSDGSNITSGTTYYFKVEPIKWRILTESNGEALILCESIITNKRYAASSNNYKNSEVRAWLNSEFYNTAFTELQKQLILTTEVDNSVYSTGYDSNPNACDNTFDKVFLLSYREVTNSNYGFDSNYSTYDAARRKLTTDYSRSTGVRMNTSSSYFGNGFWWLRSPVSYSSSNASSVYHAGSVYDDHVRNADNGVVPALKIKLN